VADATVTTRLGAYRKLVGAQVRSQTAYRASFAIDLGTNALIPILDIATVIVMFRVTRSLGGFPAIDVVVMYGLSATAFTLCDLCVGNIEKIRLYVRTGLMDAVLVRPLGTLGQLLTIDFTLRRAVRVLVAAGILAVALHRVGVDWTPERAALLVVAPLAGALFFCAIFVASATVAFWWIESGEFANAFTYGGRDFTLYPVTVYGGFFRRLFAYSLGFAFVGYYPALALLGRADPLGLPPWVAWLGPAVALAAAGVAALIWRTGVRHYRSTGS
jgi:ABC-2 type transport system permease protein